jgi:integrase
MVPPRIAFAVPSTSTQTSAETVIGHTNPTHPDLQDLAQELPAVLQDKWSASTTAQYQSSFKLWFNWASKFEEVSDMPAQPLYVCLFLISLAQRSVSVATLNSAVASIAWAHKIRGFDSPTLDSTVCICIEGLRRRLSKPARRASPILPKHIALLIKNLDSDSLADLRVASLILLAFSGFLRFSELVNIRKEDIEMLDTHMVINITSSKTDQLRKGHKIHIAKTGSPCCPVLLLIKYLEKADIAVTDTGFIFRNMYFKNGLNILAPADKQMTYTRVREIVKLKFQSLGLDSAAYTLHSLRSGGASAAAKHNVPDRLFQRHGRWKTDSIKNSYVEESTDNLLLVSRNLGI